MNPTTEQVIEAIKESIKHHKDDGCMRTQENYLGFDNSCDSCALCKLYGYISEVTTSNCNKCFLRDNTVSCCKEWLKVSRGQRESDFPEFHAGEVALVKRMECKLEQLENIITIPIIGSVKNGTVTFYDDKQKKAGYQVGDEFVPRGESCHTMSVWYGMKCKVVRIDKNTEKYEAFVLSNNGLDGSDYPDGWKSGSIDCLLPIARCIDPRFWTVEKDDVLYRAYEDSDGDMEIWWCNKDGNRNWEYVSSDFPEILANKNKEFILNYLSVPVMPHGYMGNNYDFEYPIWKENANG